MKAPTLYRMSGANRAVMADERVIRDTQWWFDAWLPVVGEERLNRAS